MKPIKYTMMLVITCLCSWSVAIFALEQQSVRDNQLVSIKLSAKDITRLMVSHDRINDIKAVKGAFVIKVDPQLGQAFLSPQGRFKGQPTTLFISTEKGHSYTALAIPVDMPGDTVVLAPKRLHPPMPRWERAAHYDNIVLRLLTALKQQRPLTGFEVVTPPQHITLFIKPKVALQLTQIYHGAKLQGERYTLVNQSTHAINLKDTDFLRPGLRAVSIEATHVPAKGHTTVLEVMDYE